MAWSDSSAALNSSCLDVFGIVATWTPAGTGVPAAITGIIEEPVLEEPFLPGSAAGVSNVRLWVDFASFDAPPAKGDGIVIDGVSYDVAKVEVDAEGGAVLILKRNA